VAIACNPCHARAKRNHSRGLDGTGPVVNMGSRKSRARAPRALMYSLRWPLGKRGRPLPELELSAGRVPGRDESPSAAARTRQGWGLAPSEMSVRPTPGVHCGRRPNLDHTSQSSRTSLHESSDRHGHYVSSKPLSDRNSWEVLEDCDVWSRWRPPAAVKRLVGRTTHFARRPRPPTWRVLAAALGDSSRLERVRDNSKLRQWTSSFPSGHPQVIHQCSRGHAPSTFYSPC